MNAILPAKPLNWSQYAITFDAKDNLKYVAGAGMLSMMCTPTISNVVVTKTLINGGAGLNVLCVKTFNTLQVPYDQLMPTRTFSGVTNGSTTPRGRSAS